MTYLDDWRATHRGLSMLDLKFREMAKDSPEHLDRKRFQVLEEKQALVYYALQSWPTFVGSEKLAEIERVSVEIVRLLGSIPEQIFRRDAAKLAAFYGLTPTVAEVVFSPPTGADAMVSRGDFIETASGFKCIEFNFTPSLGGWDIGMVMDMQLSAPPTARFIESEGLEIRFKDPLREMFRHAVDRFRLRESSGEITLAFNVLHDKRAVFSQATDHFERELKQTIEAMGLDLRGLAVASSYESLVSRENGIFLGEQKIDAVFEVAGWPTPPHLYWAFKRGFVDLYNGPLGYILSSKRNIALLSQYAASGAYSPAERAFIEAHVPWTRLVAPGEIDYAGRTWSLVELLTKHRGQFVLKNSNGQGGQGVVMGNFASAEEWRRTLHEALAEGSWVVQEVQASLPYLYQSGDYGCSIHDMIWGPFVFGDRYGGVVLRMQPRAAGGAVNLSLHATEGIVLEV